MNAKFLARLLPSVQRDIFLPCSYVNAFWFGDASLSLWSVKAYYTLRPDVKNKKKQCGFLCLFVCLFARLFVCLILFPFVSFLVSLFFDDRCSSICPNLNEYFDKHLQNDKPQTNMVKNLRTLDQFFCVPLKPNTFRMSLPEVIMIANAFAMSILCGFLGCHFRK